MYIAQTIDSKHSLISAYDERDNTVTVSVFEGTFPFAGSRDPVAQFKFNAREARDLELGLQGARGQVEDAANAAHA